MALSANDPSSFSNPEDNRVTKLDLRLEIDFDENVLRGEVDLTVERKTQSVDILILDTRDVKVEKVNVKATGEVLNFTLSDPVLSFGSKLEIKLPSFSETNIVITIQYETSPNCTALQWLKPEQTAGKRQPYLFSQCQAIHCRSMIPCQDTPAVKCKYTAEIVAPTDIVVLMSALNKDPEKCPGDPSKRVHHFSQDVPVPTYLIAIVGGDLESREIGPRSKVWSEKETVDKAKYEFAETEAMLKNAEDLMGPYVWGQYDLLVLPPTFPYGGMENPCLTFVTPTLLAGDRSLADVVAHEITHSWTGNLVTNSSPEHFWLNEGHTVFVERKITARLKNGEPFRSFMSAAGWQDLQDAVNHFNGGPLTKLVPDLKGIDPDDAFSAIPYEKGSALLLYLESILGGPAAFEPFLRAYIEKFKYQSINTDQWKDFLYSYFKGEKEQAALAKVDWEGWLYGAGMPPVKPDYDTSMASECLALCQKWCEAADDNLDQFKQDDLKSFLSVQVQEFLSLFLTKPALSLAKVKKMENVYKFNDVKNCEIRFRWTRVCLRAHWEDIIPGAIQFVTEQGRMKYTRPVYRDLYEWEVSRPAAVANFNAHKVEMHNTTASLVAKDMKLTS